MSAVDTKSRNQSHSSPGLVRVILATWPKSTEEIYRKASSGKTASPNYGLRRSLPPTWRTMSSAYAAPLRVDFDAIDQQRLPRLLDPKIGPIG
jgi:hypothetical protein